MNPTVELFLPVFNEEAALSTSIPRVVSAAAKLPYPTRVVILDNASTDATQGVGRELAAMHPTVSYQRLDQKGRGYALKAAWLASDADIVAYMDIDLSTDLSHLPQLIDAVASGADLAIGSRLIDGAQVHNRTRKREVLSRGYNVLLRFTLASPAKDAQCGFKAIRTAAFRQLASEIVDTQWFFDSELLMAAERSEMSVVELPVRWVDDQESSVRVGRTVVQDLSGIWRLWSTTLPNSLFTRLLTFSVIGLISTIGYAALYWLLSPQVGAQAANLLALVVMTVLNTALNRRLTFRIRGPQRIFIHQLVGFAALVGTWAFSAGAIALLYRAHPGVSVGTATIWATAASLVATALKYILFSIALRKPEVAAEEAAKKQEVAA